VDGKPGSPEMNEEPIEQARDDRQPEAENKIDQNKIDHQNFGRLENEAL
jgi:hypothetical protein